MKSVTSMQFVSRVQQGRKVSLSSRIAFLASLLFCAATAICLRLYFLQSDENIIWLKRAAGQHIASVEIKGARGSIYDSNGRILAVSIPTVSIGVIPKLTHDRVALVQKLSSIIGKSTHELFSLIEGRDSFTWIARNLPISVENKLDKLNISGLNVFREFSRNYPQGRLAGPILGRVSRSGVGQGGLELAFDVELSAMSKEFRVTRDARGNHVKLLSAKSDYSEFNIKDLANNLLYRPIFDLGIDRASLRQEGSFVQLSIDSVVQRIVEEEFNRGNEETWSKKVFGVIMDAQNGEILALAQSPGFNPASSAVVPGDFKNSVIQDSFEPGSTFKPLVAALAIDQKIISEDEIVNCENGSYRVSNKIIHDVHPVGVVPFHEVIARSSNICMAKLGLQLGKKKLYHFLRELKFGLNTGVELPGEASGILRNSRSWREVDVAVHSFGHGIAVTALQLVRAYAVIANGGRLVRPTLLKNSDGDDYGVRVVSEDAADRVAQMMKGVTEASYGTGKLAAINGISVYGKTGTAQKPNVSSKGYDSAKVVSSFVGFVDGNEIGLQKKLVMFVAVDEPDVKPRWGGAVAAPIFRRAMERVLTYYMTSNNGMRMRVASVRGKNKA